jgi:hypothetical protein
MDPDLTLHTITGTGKQSLSRFLEKDRGFPELFFDFLASPVFVTLCSQKF